MRIARRMLLLAVAVLATAACTRHIPSPLPPTTVAPTNTHTAAPASSTSKPPLQPGPHSAVADVDLPVGTVQCIMTNCLGDYKNTDPHSESWRYSAPYDDVVAFMRTRFATGRRYDTHGATWWKGLPPCYEPNHQSPPWGWTHDDGVTEWEWSDGATTLDVGVLKAGAKLNGGSLLPFGRIDMVSLIVDPKVGATCYRA